MEINFRLDTNQPNDLAQLAKLAGAFNGTGAPSATPAPVKTPAAKPDPVVKDDGKALADMGAGDTRVTIEMVRELAAKKKSGDVKAIINEMGYDGLSKVPAEKLAELHEKVKPLADK